MAEYFKRSMPEEQGIDSENIVLFMKEIEDIGYNLRTFLVIRHGKIVAEAAQYPFLLSDKRLVYSVSKTFTSTAIGIAVGEKLLSIEDRVLSFFPEYENLELDDRVRKLTIRNLLMMSTGHGVDSVGDMCNGDDDWIKTFLTTKMCYEPGEKFVYDSGGTYMLSEILSRVTHRPMDEYLKEKLFEPLNITDILWDRHNDTNTGGWGVLIAPEDLAKLGMLYLRKGEFGGKRILSEEWVAEASAGQIATGCTQACGWSKAYGYQIWKCNEDSFRADGAFGQFCMVFPKEDMVVVTTAEEGRPDRLFPLVEKYLLGRLDAGVSQPDAITYGDLKKKIAGWETPDIFSPTESYMEHLMRGRVYRIEDQSGKAHCLTFDICNSRMSFTIDGIQVIESSNVTYIFGETNYVVMPPSVSPIIGEAQRNRKWKYSARHEWINDGVLKVTVWYRETGHKQDWTFVFTEDRIQLVISNGIKRLMGLSGAKSDRNVDFGDMMMSGSC